MSLGSPLRTFQSSLRLSLTLPVPRNSLRYASLNSAIGRGIRRSQGVEDSGTSSYDSRDRSRAEKSSFRSRNDRNRKERWEQLPEMGFDEDEFIRTGNFRALPPEHQRFQSAHQLRDNKESNAVNRGRLPQNMRDNQESQSAKRGRSLPQYVPTPEDEEKRRSRRIEHHKSTEENPERVKQHVWVPPTIPYTTSASEFIYGTTAVEAALRCSKRQLYKLYLYQAAGEEELSVDKRVLRKLALSKNVKVKLAFGEWNRLLDKMSAGRPHNGCVLEASPLPRTPIQALKPVQLGDGQFRVELAPQTREEAEVNGTNEGITINASYTQQQIRYPVVVLLEGVVDTGNLGSIIRSAYYLGVDAIVFAGRHSAPLSPVTIKASAGAAENMSLLDVQNEVDFIKRSQANGWRFYAADVPKWGATYLERGSLHPLGPTAATGEGQPDALIGQSPSVIMMGYEGSGLSNHIKARADSIVSIPGARLLPGVGAASDPARVDSLNVSVAAALLMETFLRVPLGVSPVRSD
ncbi:Alpha/beta knot methyltransferase [Aspergillus falconensis]